MLAFLSFHLLRIEQGHSAKGENSDNVILASSWKRFDKAEIEKKSCACKKAFFRVSLLGPFLGHFMGHFGSILNAIYIGLLDVSIVDAAFDNL